MHKGFLSSVAVAIMLTVVSPQDCKAVLFDFATLAQTGGEGTWLAKTGGSYTISGITVTASAISGAPFISVPYLDAYDSGRPAGLGVCSYSNGACGGNSDDNIGYARDNSSNPKEKLTLTFTSGPVLLTDLYFRDRDHYNFYGSLLINGIGYNVPNVSGSSDQYGHLHFSTPLFGDTFIFKIGGNDGHANDRDFYLSKIDVTAVPGPIAGAGLPGLAVACGGFFAWWRRRRQTRTALGAA